MPCNGTNQENCMIHEHTAYIETNNTQLQWDLLSIVCVCVCRCRITKSVRNDAVAECITTVTPVSHQKCKLRLNPRVLSGCIQHTNTER